MKGKKKRGNAYTSTPAPVRYGALALICLSCLILNACAASDPEVNVRGQYDFAVGKVKRF